MITSTTASLIGLGLIIAVLVYKKLVHRSRLKQLNEFCNAIDFSEWPQELKTEMEKWYATALNTAHARQGVHYTSANTIVNRYERWGRDRKEILRAILRLRTWIDGFAQQISKGASIGTLDKENAEEIISGARTVLVWYEEVLASFDAHAKEAHLIRMVRQEICKTVDHPTYDMLKLLVYRVKEDVEVLHSKYCVSQQTTASA